MRAVARASLWRMPSAWWLGIASTALMVVVFATEWLAPLRGQVFAMPLFIGAIVVPPAAMLALAFHRNRHGLASWRAARRAGAIAILVLEWTMWCVVFLFLLPLALSSALGL